MPGTLHGTGSTRRGLVLEMARDAFARGHTIPLGGYFRQNISRQMTAPMHVETILTSLITGKR